MNTVCNIVFDERLGAVRSEGVVVVVDAVEVAEPGGTVRGTLGIFGFGAFADLGIDDSILNEIGIRVSPFAEQGFHLGFGDLLSRGKSQCRQTFAVPAAR